MNCDAAAGSMPPEEHEARRVRLGKPRSFRLGKKSFRFQTTFDKAPDKTG
jgi:hypothetical protein